MRCYMHHQCMSAKAEGVEPRTGVAEGGVRTQHLGTVP